MKELTQAARTKVVKKVCIDHHKRGDDLGPNWAFKDEELNEIWTVWVTLRDGLLPEEISQTTFFHWKRLNILKILSLLAARSKIVLM